LDISTTKYENIEHSLLYDGTAANSSEKLPQCGLWTAGIISER